jgi:hypothetical protein
MPVGAGLRGAGKPWLPPKWDFKTDLVVARMSDGVGMRRSRILIMDTAPAKHTGVNSSVSGGGVTMPTRVNEATLYSRPLAFVGIAGENTAAEKL